MANDPDVIVQALVQSVASVADSLRFSPLTLDDSLAEFRCAVEALLALVDHRQIEAHNHAARLHDVAIAEIVSLARRVRALEVQQ